VIWAPTLAAVKMRQSWERGVPPAARLGLGAVALGYRGLLGLRDLLYGTGVLKSRRLPCPVIAIGNLALGGTGKTPAVELAVQTLKQAGIEPAIVSRGYGRNSSGIQVVSDRQSLRLDPRASGDEPFLLARRLPGVPVVVGENRFLAGQLCLERFRVKALVLDDAFQHRTLQKDLEVVLLNGRAPWGSGRLFPLGVLREPLAALRRAHMVVVTRSPDADTFEKIVTVVRRHNETSPVVRGEYEPVECWEIHASGSVGPEALGGRRLAAFAGIAHPQDFHRTAEQVGVTVTHFTEFPDHYWYREEDVAHLTREARRSGAEGLVTTEKDWVRLSTLAPPSLPLWVLRIRLALGAGFDRFRSVLMQAARQ
jgi:tetraacyldisaccharide 4'-kinase